MKTAQCYKTQDGHVCINITQRLPIVRIKSSNGDDYYLDDQGGIMPNSKYTSDLIIATGNISKNYAKNYLGYLSETLMENDLWRNLVEQINILPDKGVEIVPRVGDNIVFIGYLPESKQKADRKKLIDEFVSKKMNRLENFYRYGLSEGWMEQIQLHQPGIRQPDYLQERAKDKMKIKTKIKKKKIKKRTLWQQRNLS